MMFGSVGMSKLVIVSTGEFDIYIHAVPFEGPVLISIDLKKLPYRSIGKQNLKGCGRLSRVGPESLIHGVPVFIELWLDGVASQEVYNSNP